MVDRFLPESVAINEISAAFSGALLIYKCLYEYTRRELIILSLWLLIQVFLYLSVDSRTKVKMIIVVMGVCGSGK